MTGPEHYREAERLIGLAPENKNLIVTRPADVIATAQVHATLALAAATAEAFTPLDRSVQTWTEVIR